MGEPTQEQPLEQIRHHTKSVIFDFIEVFYNRPRRHTSLGGLSPAQFELKNN